MKICYDHRQKARNGRLRDFVLPYGEKNRPRTEMHGRFSINGGRGECPRSTLGVDSNHFGTRSHSHATRLRLRQYIGVHAHVTPCTDPSARSVPPTCGSACEPNRSTLSCAPTKLVKFRFLYEECVNAIIGSVRRRMLI